ncbi:MAG TPA: hypothetical protein VGB75_06180 [Jatrophihabitans sp.]|jgi:hypothetical protein|uniref:hypothetical protein n=1 Tax=Jatrophihabitans sp. TaxID=1932789 RepID=UPI002F1F1BFB
MLDRIASVLERRFLLNALVPVGLFFGGYAWLLEWARGRLAHDVASWSQASSATKVLLVAAFFGVTWFAAGFLSNQWRNVIRVYEGYQFRGPLKPLAALGTNAHRERWLAMDQAGIAFYAEYPLDPYQVLPTRLGNVLRAAEYYASDRYGADYLLLWTRLGHLVPQGVRDDMEDYRANLEFLVVAAAGFVTFGCLGAVTVAVTGHGPLLFLALLVGGAVLSYVGYAAAIETAKGYGEAMRASFDLFRNELLMRLRWPIPTDPATEMRTWKELCDFLYLGEARTTQYAKAWIDVDPERLY